MTKKIEFTEEELTRINIDINHEWSTTDDHINTVLDHNNSPNTKERHIAEQNTRESIMKKVTK